MRLSTRVSEHRVTGRRSTRWRLGWMLGLVGLVASTTSVTSASAHPDRSADTVLRNGFVYTVDARDSVAGALAIDRGEIVYVGGNAGARRFIGRDTEVIDLKGRMVMPGLHEGHIHDVVSREPGRPTCDLQSARLTAPQFQARIRACLGNPALGSEPDDVLFVDNFYMQFLQPYGTAPHKRMLDPLGTRRPIFVSAAVTGHTVLVNQNALNLAGITRDTPDPNGGRINRDPNGEPNGLLEDDAAFLVLAALPTPAATLSADREVELAGQRMREFSREGVTSFFVPGTGVAGDQIRTFQRLRDQGGLTARAHFALFAGVDDISDPGQFYRQIEQTRRDVERPSQLPLSVRDWRPGPQHGPRLVARPGVSVDGVKIFLDGIAQFPGQTAAMLEPYLDSDGKPRTDTWARGALWSDGTVVDPFVAELERRGFQSHIHAIGDRAVRVALDSFQTARRQNPRIRAHQTIAHAEITHPADYRRFGALDVTASMGLLWAKPGPDSTIGVKPYIGARYDLYEPTVPITRAGGTVSLGSDCCLEPFDEWFNLEVSILREGDWGPAFPEFSGKLNALPGLSRAEGIRAVTINGAYQMHQEKVTGSLERGKLADLIVLDQNIMRVPRDDISETDVLMTMVGGKRVWTDPAFR